ncbi:polysaccharide deacetylase family protein [Calothrix sp. NIES-2098]|uniref:polysaccharide deacetylase family protein n=1 Tax=Calothrix sp. NIES-2098 TaxID=1954171 RepID=UPI000B607584|nr:polysaccharide deacetylase [Calothrix sp. NIES-2098]
MTSNSIKPIRWYLKKTARYGMCLATLPSKQLSLSSNQLTDSPVRVLTYHRFGDSERDPFCVGLNDFQAQMEWIANQNLVVSLTDIENFLAGKKDLPKNAVLVTVDDGHQSLYTNALPILKQYSIPAVAFITTSKIDSASQNNQFRNSDTTEAYLSWKEVEALAEAGVSIGSHAHTHRSLGKISMDEAHQEAVMSREAIEKNLGLKVTSFAYPFGTLADFNDSTTLILKQSGYKLAFTSQHGAINPKLDPLVLPRVKVEGGEPIWMFRLLVSGGLDEWRLIDSMLWRFQQSP